MTKRYFIVWNGDRSEGFITDCHGAALNAHHFIQDYWEGAPGVSTIGLAFAETYRDEAEGTEYPDIQTVEIAGDDPG